MRMKRSTGVRAAGVALALVCAASVTSCSSSGTKTSSTTSTSISATTEATVATPTTLGLTSADLQVQLLALSDLPSGWTVDNSSNSGSGTPKCLQDAQNAGAGRKAQASAQYQGASSGLPSLEELLAYLPGHAEPAMADIQTALSHCGTITFETSGVEFSGTVSELLLPTFAQQSEAFSIAISAKVKGSTVNADVDVVALRYHYEVALIIYGALGASNPSVDEHYAQAAANKIEAGS
jgi:hypothetical protein